MTSQHDLRTAKNEVKSARDLLRMTTQAVSPLRSFDVGAKFRTLKNLMPRSLAQLACGTSLIALMSVITVTSSIADDFVVDTATTVTNGDAANVLDGADNLLITSDGRIATAMGDKGVLSTGAGDHITNAGHIETTGDGDYGIQSTGDDATVINSGEILTHQDSASGIASQGDRFNVINSGRITTNGEHAHGINSSGVDTVVNNSGVIESIGDSVRGINVSGENAYVVNSGKITLTGTRSTGIVTGKNSHIQNSGSISLGGANSLGIVVNGRNASAENTGDVLTTGSDSVGIISTFEDSIITNSGIITTEGLNSHGIQSLNNRANIINTGIVRTTDDGGLGVYIQGANSNVTNSGTIETSGDSSYAIVADASATRVNIQNLATISTTGDFGYGISFGGERATIFNGGTITTIGSNAIGVHSVGAGFSFENAGSISIKYGGSGVHSTGEEASIINSGSIVVENVGSGYGIYSIGDDTVITNSGKVISTKSNAFFAGGARGILNLHAPSFIGGAFDLPGSGDTTELNIKTDASHSVLWKFDPTHLDNGAPKVSGDVPGFYDAGTGRFATYDPTVLAVALDQLSEKTGLVSDLAARKASGDDIWVSAIGNFSNVDGNDSTLDRDTTSAGVAFGASRQISNTFRINGMFGYLDSKAEASSRWTQSLDNKTQSFFANVNADLARENYDLNFGLTAGFSNHDNRRFVNDNLALTDGKTLGQSWATSKYSSWWFSPEITISRDIEQASGWTLTPLAQARYSFEAIQSSTESGSNANANVASRMLGLIEGKAEVSASKKFDRIKFTARAGVQGSASVGGDADITLVDVTQSISNSFDNRVSGYVGADLSYEFNDKTAFNISSKGTLGGGIKSASIFANLTRKF